MDKINELLENINIIYKRKQILDSLMKKPEKKTEKEILYRYISWERFSCWLDSELMGILAFPVECVKRNILELDKLDITKINPEQRQRMTCKDEVLQNIHELIKELYRNMHLEESNQICSATNLWKLMDDCNLAVEFGEFGSTGAVFDRMLKYLYPNVFIQTSMRVWSPKKIEERLYSEIFFEKGLLYQKKIVDKLLIVTLNEIDSNSLTSEIIVGDYKFKLISIVYNCSSNHICSFIRNYDNEWFFYNGMAHIFNPVGSIIKVNETIVNLEFKKEFVLTFEITQNI